MNSPPRTGPLWETTEIPGVPATAPPIPRVPDLSTDVSRERLAWLVRLRWHAMMGVLGATVVGVLGWVPGLNWPVTLAAGLAGLSFNAYLLRRLKAGTAATGSLSLSFQGALDILILTVVLGACGGTDTPFLGFYFFHVAIVGILGARWGVLLAVVVVMISVGFLYSFHFFPELRYGTWDPEPGFAVVMNVFGFGGALGLIAYIVQHAIRELRDREAALSRARDRARLEYELLSNTLDELGAGLELVGEADEVIWRNKRAQAIADSTEELSAKEPEERFAVTLEDGEYVYESHGFSLSPSGQGAVRRMNLYVDRTNAVMGERQLLLAERLASLGRVAQGVAHELNTPLATIRTLATDLRSVVGQLDGVEPAVSADLTESIELIRDETGRLGRITQNLLTRGDLVSGHRTGHVALLSLVERAQAVVFAGTRDGGPELHLDPKLDTAIAAVEIDPLIQILVNLLQNAVDALRDHDAPRIDIRVRPQADRWVLEIEDNGPGVPGDVEPRLFEPFATSKPPGEGTGLGLYTSYMLAQGMNGELSYRQGERGGARFSLALPRATGDAESVVMDDRVSHGEVR